MFLNNVSNCAICSALPPPSFVVFDLIPLKTVVNLQLLFETRKFRVYYEIENCVGRKIDTRKAVQKRTISFWLKCLTKLFKQHE